MKKYTKISASVIISLALFLGLVASAEVSKINNNKNNEVKKEEYKKDVKDVIKKNTEQFKTKLDEMVGSIKVKREEFKKELIVNKELAKQKIAAKRVEFQTKLDKIKDVKKKTATEKIVNGLNSLNIRLTDQYSNKIDQIESVLVSVQSRIDKAGNRGINVTLPSAQVLKAKETIESARVAIALQAKKTYETNIDEATLKSEMKKLSDTFRADMKVLSAKVKDAHIAVKNTATNLAQIPKIDDDKNEGEKGLGDKSATGEVENNTATSENN